MNRECGDSARRRVVSIAASGHKAQRKEKAAAKKVIKDAILAKQLSEKRRRHFGIGQNASEEQVLSAKRRHLGCVQNLLKPEKGSGKKAQVK